MANPLNFIQKILPWIGAAATGNIPQFISLAAQAVSSVTGKKVESNADSIASAIAGATPDQILALKQADNDLQVKMATLNINSIEELLKLDDDDRANARAREIAVKDSTPKQLAWVIIVASLLGDLGVVIMTLKYPTVSSIQTAVIMSVLKTWEALALCVGYYFYGSSAGSHAKDDTVKLAVAKGVE